MGVMLPWLLGRRCWWARRHRHAAGHPDAGGVPCLLKVLDGEGRRKEPFPLMSMVSLVFRDERATITRLRFWLGPGNRYSYQHAWPMSKLFDGHRLPPTITLPPLDSRLPTLFFVSSVLYWLSAWFAPVFVLSALPLDLSTRVLNPALTRTLAWYSSPITTLDLIRASSYQHHHPSAAYEP